MKMKMKIMFEKIKNKISSSLLDKDGKVSHTRISSYIILISILLSSLTFLVIDIVNAISMWSKDIPYEIPMSHVTIFGMILGHHLFLLGIKKSSENKDKFEENSNIKNEEDII